MPECGRLRNARAAFRYGVLAVALAWRGGMRFLTDFADLAVVGPLAVCVAAALAAAGWWRGAAAWVTGVVATLSAMLALKLLFLGCAPAGNSHVFSPSGHVAGGTVLYGGMAAVWLYRRMPLGLAVVAGGAPVAALVATTRLALHLHSVPEVGIGACAGLAGLVFMLGWAGRAPVGLRVGKAALVVLPLMVILHGLRVPAEARIRSAAGWLPARVCEAFE